MFHPQRTWLIYLLILASGLILAEIGHRKFMHTCSRIHPKKTSNIFIFTILTSILLIFSSALLSQANPINHRGDVVPYWSVCLFGDWMTGIQFSVLTLSILALLGITQISWGNIYLELYQNTKNHNLTYMTGCLQAFSGAILLSAHFPIYYDVFGYSQFHFLLFVPFLVSQIITSVTFLTSRKMTRQN